MSKSEQIPQQGQVSEREPSAETIEESGDLLAVIRELTIQIELSNQLTEEEIQEKLLERGNLIGEEKKAFDAIEGGEEQLEYFQTRQKLGEFQDAKSKELIARLEETIKKAKDALISIKARIDAVSGRPEILERLEKEAFVEQERRLKIEQANQLIDRIAGYKQRYGELNNKYYELDSINQKAVYEIDKLWRSFVIQANDSRKSELSSFLGFLDWKALYRDTNEETLEKLKKYRGKLGVFATKEKAIIDSMLKQLPPAIEKIRKRVIEIDALVSEQKNLKLEAENVRKQFGAIIRELDPHIDEPIVRNYLDVEKRYGEVVGSWWNNQEVRFD